MMVKGLLTSVWVASIVLAGLARSSPSAADQQRVFGTGTSAHAYSETTGDDVRSTWPQDAVEFAVDYYPSQWPRHMWESDAQRMANASITHVRINEFDWALLEPQEGTYDWSILDDSIDVLARHGLKVILGTPTATPPLWIVEKYDILGVNNQMQQRRFGSRRHYSFSSPDYRKLSQGIVRAMAERYGKHEAISSWQLDNEFGNTETARSFDRHATVAFRQWLEVKYGNVTNLNDRQGRVFWSSQFDTFDQIVPPTLENEESSPALRMDFFRFSSDELIDFAAIQAEAIREVAREQGYRAKPITTNFMGFEFAFDHYTFMDRTGIDFATWDSYPLGNGEQFGWATEEDKIRYARTGRPDHQSLHHAIYRGLGGVRNGNRGRGPWGVMEQQPGPVNWAMANPSPAPGQIRLWLHDMTAHGSSLNNIFRWRQVPYGQEQMHAAMLRPDNVDDVAWHEQQMAVRDVEALKQAQVDLTMDLPAARPRIALLYDYTSHWYIEAQPQSGRFSRSTFVDYAFQYPELVTNWYEALRRLALDVDVIGPNTQLDGYDVLVIPSMVEIDPRLEQALKAFEGDVIMGPRTASKDDPLRIPDGLPPAAGPIRDRLPMKVTRVESIRVGGLGDQVTLHRSLCPALRRSACTFDVEVWSEWLECQRGGQEANVASSAVFKGYRDGEPAMCQHVEHGRRTTYIGWYAKADAMMPILAEAARRQNITTLLGQTPSVDRDLGQHVRFARRGNALFAFNYDDKKEATVPLPNGRHLKAELVVGGVQGKAHRIGKSGVNIYKLVN